MPSPLGRSVRRHSLPRLRGDCADITFDFEDLDRGDRGDIQDRGEVILETRLPLLELVVKRAEDR